MKFKRLLPALATLVISAMLVTTTTYAWFSMNKDVTATNMQITAKSDAIFLEISGAADGGSYSLVGTSDVDGMLYPTHHEDWSTKADITDFDLDDDGDSDNWFYRYNANSDHATNARTEIQYLDTFTDYVEVTSYSVRLHEGSQETGYDLHVKSISIPADTGITVVIVGAEGYAEFNASQANISYANATVLSNTVTTTAQTVTVYLYFDGEDENVYTDNILALTGEIEFVLTAYEADHT